MKKYLLILVLSSLLISQEQDLRKKIVIYKDSFSVIKEPLSLSLRAGLNPITFSNLSQNVIDNSLFLDLQGATILSQNISHNRFGIHQFMKKNIGASIELKPQSGSSIQGLLLDYNDKEIVLKTSKGLSIFYKNNLEYISLKSSEVSDKFSPEIEWVIQSDFDQNTNAEVHYISSDFSWNAIYNLIIDSSQDSSATKAELTINAEITNNSNMNLFNVDLSVIEGTIPFNSQSNISNTLSRIATKIEDAVKIGDYYSFTLGNDINLKSLETNLYPLLAKRVINYDKRYIFRNNERDQKDEPLNVEILFQNSDENNLNIPLPSGTINLFEKSQDGSINMLSKNIFQASHKGSLSIISAGKSFDINGKRRILNYDRQNNSEESTISLQVINSSGQSIKVKLEEKIFGDWVVKESSSMYIKEDANTIYFPLEIKPNSSETVTYSYRKEWK
jgi:hypothetical protein